MSEAHKGTVTAHLKNIKSTKEDSRGCRDPVKEDMRHSRAQTKKMKKAA